MGSASRGGAEAIHAELADWAERLRPNVSLVFESDLPTTRTDFPDRMAAESAARGAGSY